MKKITAVTMFILAILAIFFEAEAGIISKKYDAVSDEMLIDYKVLDKDTVWDICNKITVKQMSMDFIEKNIMAPSNITDPTKIRIGKVLKIRIKKSDFKDIAPDVILTGDSLAIERQQSAASGEEKSVALAKHNVAPPANQGKVSDKNMVAVLAENQRLVEQFEKISKELNHVQEASSTKIKELEKTIAGNNERILAMESAVAVKSEAKKTRIQESEVVAEIQKATPDRAVIQYYQRRNLTFSGIFVLIAIGVVFTFRSIKKDRSKYSYEEKYNYGLRKRFKRRIVKFFEPKTALSSSS